MAGENSKATAQTENQRCAGDAIDRLGKSAGEPKAELKDYQKQAAQLDDANRQRRRAMKQLDEVQQKSPPFPAAMLKPSAAGAGLISPVKLADVAVGAIRTSLPPLRAAQSADASSVT